MSEEITERIRQIMQEYGYSSSVFADEIGVQRPAISHILSGRNRASLDVVLKIIKAFPQINSKWILTGEGRMKQLDMFENEPVKEKKSSLEPDNKTIESKNIVAPPIPVTPPTPLAVPEEKLQLNPIPEPVRNPEPVDEKYFPATPTAHANRDAVLVQPESPHQIKDKQLENRYIQHKKEENIPLPILPPAMPGKKIERVMVFYSDKTFSVYTPED